MKRIQDFRTRFAVMAGGFSLVLSIVLVAAIVILISSRAYACPMKGMMGTKMDDYGMMKEMKEHHERMSALLKEMEEHEKLVESATEKEALISEIKKHIKIQDSLLKEMISHCARMHSMMQMECGEGGMGHKGH